jgi:hypothetical protein
VVEVGLQAHEIVRDPAARRMLAQHRYLFLLKADELVAGEAIEVEHVRWIRVLHRQVRQRDLVEAAVLLAPEHRAPRIVEVVDLRVTLTEPFAKRQQRVRGIRLMLR